MEETVMRKPKSGFLAAMLVSGMCLLSGCGQVDETILDAQADLSVSINVPYATATPLPEYLDVPDPVVIDSNGGVTVNDLSLLPSNSKLQKEDNSKYTPLSLGDTGLAVQALQQRLKDLYYFGEGVSGIFDASTEAAVKRFEKTYGIMQTGIATSTFQSKLFSSAAVPYGSEAYDSAVVSHYHTLQSGAVGSSVYALQLRLKELGYPIKELTGIYDADTENAIRLFYVAYGLEPESVAYIALQKELYAENARPYSIGGEVQTSDIDETALAPGNVGTLVMQVQNRLIQLGYMTGTASGIYDAGTEAAARLFEAACGFEQTGTLSYTLQAILLSDQAPAYGSSYSEDQTTYTDLSEGSQGNEVLNLQERLIDLGYAAGKGNGIYGAETTTALKMFQRYNNLEETGVASAYVQSCLFSPTAITYEDVLRGITARTTPLPVVSTTVAPSNITSFSDEIQSDAYRLLTMGDSGADVLRLQEQLNRMKYTCNASGIFDEPTRDALRTFQAAVGVTQNGEASADLQRYIYCECAPHKGYKMYKSTQDFVTLRPGDTGDAVTNLQKQLWKLGYLLTESVEGNIGTYHEATRLAVASAQLAMGYEEADGVASAEMQCFIFSEYNYMIKK